MIKQTIEKFKNLDVINLYNNGYSLNKLQSFCQSDKKTIRDYLLANDIEVKGLSSKVPVNKNILGLSRTDKKFNSKKFDSIDTEEKSYWLGFLFADGYISNKEFVVGLGLQASDVVHLHKFNRFMECEYNYVTYCFKKTNNKIYDAYKWSIRNENLWNTLNNYGCIPNKSLVLKFPSTTIFKDISLIKHFIRGYWDGDGCISLTTKSNSINVLGTEQFLNELKSYIPYLKNKKLYQRNKDKNTFILQTTGINAEETIRFLYQDATVYLDRKYKKYLDLPFMQVIV
jgi:hypothetical protein